jgi:hypothetical protein
MTSRGKKGKTTLVEDVPKFDVAKFSKLLSKNLRISF